MAGTVRQRQNGPNGWVTSWCARSTNRLWLLHSHSIRQAACLIWDPEPGATSEQNGLQTFVVVLGYHGGPPYWRFLHDCLLRLGACRPCSFRSTWSWLRLMLTKADLHLLPSGYIMIMMIRAISLATYLPHVLSSFSSSLFFYPSSSLSCAWASFFMASFAYACFYMRTKWFPKKKRARRRRQ